MTHSDLNARNGKNLSNLSNKIRLKYKPKEFTVSFSTARHIPKSDENTFNSSIQKKFKSEQVIKLMSNPVCLLSRVLRFRRPFHRQE